MVYAPPLIRPPLPPLRPPVAPPYRPPVLAPPPTQIDPGYEPPTLLPPTDIDLKGIVCIYSNAPIWEPKKIRYRYPGESWHEIAGENYIITLSNIAGGQDFDTWIIDEGKAISSSSILLYKNSWPPCTNPFPVISNDYGSIGVHQFTGRAIAVRQLDAVINNCGTTSTMRGLTGLTMQLEIVDNSGKKQFVTIDNFEWKPAPIKSSNVWFTGLSYHCSIQLRRLDEEFPPPFSCIFKVFDIFNQEILSITRDDCPEVIVVPEKCYFKAENEKLVRKINVSFFQDLEIKYNGNCATVLLKSYPLPLPVEIYKECSDNPNCPPPRIRFDKKCEEKCEQCPPGTAIKVLLGSRIACVDAVGCVLKSVKYKPGCNNYDCICN